MLTIVTIPFPQCDDGTVSRWRSRYPARKVVDSIEDVDVDTVTLFGDVATEVFGESFRAADVRSLASRLPDYHNVLILQTKRSSASYDKDPIEAVDLSPPKSGPDLVDYLTSAHDTTRDIAKIAVDRGSNARSSSVLCEQLALLPDTKDRRAVSMAMDLSSSTPPWRVTDAICKGNVREAALAAQDFARVVGPGAALFQILGYMRKVVVAGHDPAGVMANSNEVFFSARRRGLRDAYGLTNDLAQASINVLESRYPEYTLAAYTALMATRFAVERR